MLIEKPQPAYAGIGSRITPTNIKNVMTSIATYMSGKGWTLRSGHAEGADKSFEQIMVDFKNPNPREIYLPWKGYNGADKSNFYISPVNYPFTDEEERITKFYHPNWAKCTPSARLLHKRNTRIILGLADAENFARPVRMVICWTEQGKIIGGTGQALRLAKGLNIPVVNFGEARDQQELEALIHQIDDMSEKLKG